MKTVFVYRDELLPVSETFIAAQAAAMTRFHPRFVGLRRVARGLTLAEDVIFLSTGQGIASKLRTKLYRNTGFAPAFFRRLQGAQASLLHAHFALDGASALPLAERLNLPLIVTLHGYDVASNDQALRAGAAGRLYLARRQELWRRTAVFLCVSEFLRNRAQAAGFPLNKLLVHRIGVDIEQFHPPDRRPSSTLVLFIGRLVEKKGLEYLLRAMPLVQQQRPLAELVIIGDGPLRQPLEVLARKLGIRCRFLGVQTSRQVKQWLSEAVLLCAPSVTAFDGDTEGLPIAICEAQAMGVPVVSTFHAGIPEAVADGETGLLVPERDSDALAAALLRFMDDDALQSRVSRNAVHWMRQEFDLRRQTAKLEEIYEAHL